eukprot:70964_1
MLSVHPTMLRHFQRWLQFGTIPQLQQSKSVQIDINQVSSIVHKILNDESCKPSQVNAFKVQFIQFAVNAIRKKLVKNKQIFINSRPSIQANPYIKSAESKMAMHSVKKMKACWYQGINEDHQIEPNQRIQMDHVLALVVYSQISALCTAFRKTYRKEKRTEKIEGQKERHSFFANFGKLLYESFVFYGTTESKVELLYHGMSTELLFASLYCTINAPTSTTTASSVAGTFGGGAGIVMKLESCESTKYIRTVDMDVFTCFDHEEEHLIFETR